MVRTDLASEAVQQAGSDIEGIKSSEEKKGDITITRVEVLNEQGEKAIGKKIGNYVTISMKPFSEMSIEEQKNAQEVTAAEIRAMSNGNVFKNVLIAGLGNRNVTADSLGPAVCDNVFVTRHFSQDMIPEELKGKLNAVSAISPGVLGVTGIETGEIIRGVVKNVKPDLVLVVDSLASRSLDRIMTTIQLSDAGISPGSGIGNKRFTIDKETLKVPVIAIGVPLVVYASTIAYDLISEALGNANDANRIKTLVDKISKVNGSTMVVTPKEIDFIVDTCASVVSSAIEYAIQGSEVQQQLELIS
ncbi:MAG: GPR endopeptidase [Eubacteriales bacterium]